MTRPPTASGVPRGFSQGEQNLAEGATSQTLKNVKKLQ